MRHNKSFFARIKEFWPKAKECVVAASKFIIFSVVMVMGFWTLYVILWHILGLPITDIATWLLFVQAVVSQVLFCKWLNN